MKSKPYRFQKKLFRYDYEYGVVEYIAKATKDQIDDEIEWEQKHGSQLYGIDADGYMVLDSAGLRRENWKNKAVRDEYLFEWCIDLDEEAAALARDFEKYELPALMKEEMK